MNGKPTLPVERCRQILLSGNAISVLYCAQEQDTARVAETRAAAGAAGSVAGTWGLPPTLLQLLGANACLVAHLLSSRDQVQPLRKGDLHPGTHCLAGNQLLLKLSPGLRGFKAAKNLLNPIQ